MVGVEGKPTRKRTCLRGCLRGCPEKKTMLKCVRDWRKKGLSSPTGVLGTFKMNVKKGVEAAQKQSKIGVLLAILAMLWFVGSGWGSSGWACLRWV